MVMFHTVHGSNPNKFNFKILFLYDDQFNQIPDFGYQPLYSWAPVTDLGHFGDLKMTIEAFVWEKLCLIFLKVIFSEETVLISFYLFQLNQQQPEGAEIKIPGVGSTPIAVSTQLPAAVAQLTQKGELSCLNNFIRYFGEILMVRKKSFYNLFMLWGNHKKKIFLIFKIFHNFKSQINPTISYPFRNNHSLGK